MVWTPVPPKKDTTCGRPWSVTVKMVETGPGVWPGVTYIVTVVFPSVSFWPSVTTMSRGGIGAAAKRAALRAAKSQSWALIRTWALYFSARYLAPP